jgi:hypothetical protein
MIQTKKLVTLVRQGGKTLTTPMCGIFFSNEGFGMKELLNIGKN